MLGLAGLVPLIFGGLCIWGFFAAINASPENPPDIESWKFAAGAVIGIVLGALLIRWGWRLAVQADMTEPYSPDKPRTRF